MKQLFFDINAIGTFPQIAEVLSDSIVEDLPKESYYKNLLIKIRMERGSAETNADYYFNKMKDAIFPGFIWKKGAKRTCLIANPIGISGECLIVDSNLHEILQDFILDNHIVHPIKILNLQKTASQQYFFYTFRNNRLKWIDLRRTKFIQQVVVNGEKNIVSLDMNSELEILSHGKIIKTLDLHFNIDMDCDFFYIQTPTSNTYRYFLSNRLADKLMPYLDKSAVILPTENITINLYQEYMGLPFLF